MRHVRAEAVRFEGDEDGWHMLIDTPDELIDVHIHGIHWDLYLGCKRTLGAEYQEAMGIKREVEQAGPSIDDDPDQGYARDDPKHPDYHDRYVP